MLLLLLLLLILLSWTTTKNYNLFDKEKPSLYINNSEQQVPTENRIHECEKSTGKELSQYVRGVQSSFKILRFQWYHWEFWKESTQSTLDATFPPPTCARRWKVKQSAMFTISSISICICAYKKTKTKFKFKSVYGSEMLICICLAEPRKKVAKPQAKALVC